MLNLPDHGVIPAARQVVQICLEEIAAEGKLRDVAMKQDDFVGQISYGLLADCLQSHQLKLEMIERWTMELVAQMQHMHSRCACGHLLRSHRECVEQRCMECRVLLLVSDLPCRE